MSLSVDNVIFGELKPHRVYGSHGIGYHKLWLHYNLSLKQWSPGAITLLHLGGELLFGNTQRVVGRLEPMDRSTVIATQGWPQQDMAFYHEIDLSRERLAAIEALRKGGHITLTARIRGQAVWADRFIPLYDEVTFNVHQGPWVDCLELMGWGKTMLVEVPIPATKDGDDEAYADAVEHLARAQDHLAHANWRETVQSCRMSVEALKRLQQKGAAPATATPKKMMTLDERFEDMRAALFHIGGAAAHNDVVTHDLTSRDAAAVLAITTGLVSRFSRGN